MGTVIAIDLSVSMIRDIKIEDTGKSITLLELAIQGVNSLLDYLTVHAYFESVAVVTFSSDCEVLCSFTNDYELIKNKIAKLDFMTDICYPPVIQTINKLIGNEWSDLVKFNIIMISDGTCYEHMQKPDIDSFIFPRNLIVVPLEPIKNKNNNNRIKLKNDLGYIISPELPLTPSSIAELFKEVAKDTYFPYSIELECGALKSEVYLSPPPTSYTIASDLEVNTYYISNNLSIVGFLEMSKVGCPVSLSRHIIFPKINVQECKQTTKEALSNTLSFCVLLRSTLKEEHMAALCYLHSNWYGLLINWTNKTNKSNLMLITLKPGRNAIPWLGDLQDLTLIPRKSDTSETSHVPSYKQPQLIWMKNESIQRDLQKLVKYGRKIPNTISEFYLELNQIRKIAISYSFCDLITRLSDFLLLECKHLPRGSHPDCELQLTNAAMELQKPQAMDPTFIIKPIVT